MEPGHPHCQEYDRVVDPEERVLVGIHAWNDETGTPVDRLLAGQRGSVPGRGVLLTFTVDNFDGVYTRALEMGAQTVEGVEESPDGSRAAIIRDADGYCILLSSGSQNSP